MMAAVALTALALAASVPSRGATFEQLSRQAAQARDANHDDEAISLYRQALQMQPAWKEGLWYLSTLLYDKETFPEARDLLRRFVAHDSEAGPGWVLLGLSEFHTREYGRALNHLQHGLALGLGDRQELAHSAFYVVAALLTRFEEYDKSMDVLTRLAATGAPDAFLVEAIGLAALRLPLLPAEIPPDRRDLVHMAGAGACALATQHNSDAEKLFRQMAAAYPNEPGVHFLFGAFLMQDRPDQGIAEMKRELEINPDHAAARVRLAMEFMKEGKPDLALPFAEQAVALAPKFSAAHRALGEVLLAGAQAQKGLRELETARDQDPDVMETHWALFRAYSAAGRPEDAAREKDAIEKLKQQASR